MKVFVQLLILVTLASFCLAISGNYLEEPESEDDPDKDPILNYSSLENPFRVQKINLLWEKARWPFLKLLRTEMMSFMKLVKNLGWVIAKF